MFQILKFYDNSNFTFFFNFSKKKIGFYKLSFRFFYFNSIPRIPTPPIPRIPTSIPCIPTHIIRTPTLIFRIPTPFPAFPAFPPTFPASPPLFPAFPPHCPHSPHSVPRFPIPVFTDSQIFWILFLVKLKKCKYSKFKQGVRKANNIYMYIYIYGIHFELRFFDSI